MSTNAQPCTISLPKHMLKQAKQIAKIQHRTISELFREAFRFYQEQAYLPGEPLNRGRQPTWNELNASLRRVSKAGRKINLSQFIIEDRKRH